MCGPMDDVSHTVFQHWNRCDDNLGTSVCSTLYFLASIPALLSSVMIVMRPAMKAFRHETLVSRFFRLERSINPSDPTEDDIRGWEQELLRIYEEEPPTYHAVNAECGNAATQALGFGPEKFQKVSWSHRFFKNWFRFQATDFQRNECG